MHYGSMVPTGQCVNIVIKLDLNTTTNTMDSSNEPTNAKPPVPAKWLLSAAQRDLLARQERGDPAIEYDLCYGICIYCEIREVKKGRKACTYCLGGGT